MTNHTMLASQTNENLVEVKAVKTVAVAGEDVIKVQAVKTVAKTRNVVPQDPPPADTLIFVDVDGVLNVGISDPEQGSLSLEVSNVFRALRLSGIDQEPSVFANGCETGNQTVHRMLLTYNRRVEHGEDDSYSKFVAAPSELSDVLVGRLAQLIKLAGPRRLVVLSSSWRLPKFAGRVAILQDELSRHLGYPFHFDVSTAICKERDMKDRLLNIGNFLKAYSGQYDCSVVKLRVLVLDDFYTGPIEPIAMKNLPIDCVRGCEKYLRSRVKSTADVSVRMVHTYDECTTPSGLLVKIGSGLTSEHFCNASQFLTGNFCSYCMQVASDLPSSCSRTEENLLGEDHHNVNS